MKGLVLFLSAVLVLGIAACNDDSGTATSTGPLALAQRVVTEEDAPDSKPDPVEKRQTAADIEEFADKMGDAFINPSKQENQDLQTVGFVQAIRDTRYFGDTHSRDDAHTFSLVVQLDSPDGAKEFADFFHTDSLRPCPESCAFSVSEFDVDGIPGATGVRRFASEEAVKTAGTSNERPYDSYAIFFADGDFAYNIDYGGRPAPPRRTRPWRSPRTSTTASTAGRQRASAEPPIHPRPSGLASFRPRGRASCASSHR